MKFEWQCSKYLELNPTCVVVMIPSYSDSSNGTKIT